MEQHNDLSSNYTQWLERRTAQAKKNREQITASGGREWYAPSDSELPARDHDPERFRVTELQEKYLQILKEEGHSAGELVAVRFQAANVRACERAWLLRHTTVPKLLAHGQTENVIETNGLYDVFMTDYPANMIHKRD